MRPPEAIKGFSIDPVEEIGCNGAFFPKSDILFNPISSIIPPIWSKGQGKGGGGGRSKNSSRGLSQWDQQNSDLASLGDAFQSVSDSIPTPKFKKGQGSPPIVIHTDEALPEAAVPTRISFWDVLLGNGGHHTSVGGTKANGISNGPETRSPSTRKKKKR